MINWDEFWSASAILNFDSIFTIINENYICLTAQLMFRYEIAVKLMCCVCVCVCVCVCGGVCAKDACCDV